MPTTVTPHAPRRSPRVAASAGHTLATAAAPAAATQPGRNGAIAFAQDAGDHRQLFTIQPGRHAGSAR